MRRLSRLGPIGSIPARAGEPSGRSPSPPAKPVYPRACGGTSMLSSRSPPKAGLSPRVRGNPPWRIRLTGMMGSIPARAGEPVRCCPSPGRRAVYPRACGGTSSAKPSSTAGPGLSPRVRGNPSHWRRARRSQWVYPRACGGTTAERLVIGQGHGLSPRVRGNPPPQCASYGARRSIPARAGEPPCYRVGRRQKRVYPRACGGTHRPLCPASH